MEAAVDLLGALCSHRLRADEARALLHLCSRLGREARGEAGEQAGGEQAKGEQAGRMRLMLLSAVGRAMRQEGAARPDDTDLGDGSALCTTGCAHLCAAEGNPAHEVCGVALRCARMAPQHGYTVALWVKLDAIPTASQSVLLSLSLFDSGVSPSEISRDQPSPSETGGDSGGGSPPYGHGGETAEGEQSEQSGPERSTVTLTIQGDGAPAAAHAPGGSLVHVRLHACSDARDCRSVSLGSAHLSVGRWHMLGLSHGKNPKNPFGQVGRP